MTNVLFFMYYGVSKKVYYFDLPLTHVIELCVIGRGLAKDRHFNIYRSRNSHYFEIKKKKML